MHSIGSINDLPEDEKRDFYTNIIPDELITVLGIPRSFKTNDGKDLLLLTCPKGSTVVEMALYHQAGFPDPVFYGQMADTVTGHIHILMYMLIDPASPRFEVDCMPDGRQTALGANLRNLPAELAAIEDGLAPGQIRHGLRMLEPAINSFERFIRVLGHNLYFAEPLYYHNAVIFERYGFNYERGRSLMDRIQAGFSPGGSLTEKLDGSTPFRQPEARHSIRLRSWAIHDGLLDESFTHVTMYKMVGQHAGIDTCPGCGW